MNTLHILVIKLADVKLYLVGSEALNQTTLDSPGKIVQKSHVDNCFKLDHSTELQVEVDIVCKIFKVTYFLRCQLYVSLAIQQEAAFRIKFMSLVARCPKFSVEILLGFTAVKTRLFFPFLLVISKMSMRATDDTLVLRFSALICSKKHFSKA